VQRHEVRFGRYLQGLQVARRDESCFPSNSLRSEPVINLIRRFATPDDGDVSCL
jgi:hypothetical protein